MYSQGHFSLTETHGFFLCKLSGNLRGLVNLSSFGTIGNISIVKFRGIPNVLNQVFQFRIIYVDLLIVQKINLI